MKKISVYLSLFVVAAFVSASTISFAMQNTVLSAKETAAVLNRLVDRAVDGQKGFQDASEIASSNALKSQFSKASKEREKFAAELMTYVNTLGEKAAEGGTVEGAIYRAWVDLKTAVTRNDDRAILEAVKTAESETLATYRDALDKKLPEDVRSVVERQEKQIEKSYDWTLNNLKKIGNG